MLTMNTFYSPGFRRIAVLLLVLGMPVPGWAESTWRGQAGVASSAGLPETGLSAATNEFPRGTLLEVRNLRNNKSLQVQVLRRSPSALDLNFIYLSPQAGRDLEIRSGESVLVSVSVVQSATAIPGTDRPVSPSLTAPEGSLKPLTALTLESRTGEEVVPVQAAAGPEAEPSPAVNPVPSEAPQENVPEAVPGSGAPVEVAQASPESPTVPPAAAPGDVPGIPGEVPGTVPPAEPAEGPASETAPVNPAPEVPGMEESPRVVVLNGPAMDELVPLESPATVRTRPSAPAAETPVPEAVLPEPVLPEAEAPQTVAAWTPADDSDLPGLPGDLPPGPAAGPTTAAVSEAPEDWAPAESPAGDPSVPADVPAAVTAALPDPGTGGEVPLEWPAEPAPVLAGGPEPGSPVPEAVQTSPSAADPAGVAAGDELPAVDVPAPVIPAVTAAPAAAAPVPEALPAPSVPSSGVPASELAKLGVTTLPRQTPASKPQQSSAGDLYVSRPAPVTADPLGDVKLVSRLEGRGDYIQLASYRSQDSVIKTLEKINSYVPLVLWVPEGTTPVYRLVAGPLRRDQLGLVFKHYQDQGFRDAFIIKKP